MKNDILVVVDMQNDFIDGVLGSEEARAIVPKVVEKIKNWDGVIFNTFDIHEKSSYTGSQESEKIPIHCEGETLGMQLNEEVRIALSTKTCISYFKNRFGSMALMSDMKEVRSKNVTLIGLCTDICVISNAMLLQSIGKNITIDAACCAGSTPENHEAALKVMKACCMNIENWEGSATTTH